MPITYNFLPTLTFVIVMLCWFTFVGIFVLRKRPPSPPDRKREPGSLFGLALQALSYGIVWGFHRSAFTPIVPRSKWIAIAASILSLVAAVGSVGLIMAAVKTLGKEWSLTARLVEGHKLATTGAYAHVRHPIYTGMLGMLLATGLAFSHWAALLAALVIFFVGTTIRIRSEEKLLREAFGAQFEQYAAHVPALVPGLY
ncbi:MAG TPA: isoprenylcysteine carboxylmethyltransferase family protein [Pyrinomonadaceae bacterium]|nr:isoprenylcysteine carboxylmethyltransferase family protein [Pyrinomonadaceae bacterium]